MFHLPFRCAALALLLVLLSRPASGQFTFSPLSGLYGLDKPFQLATDQAGGIHLYSDGAMFRTPDAGLSWQPVPIGLTGNVRFINDTAGVLYAVPEESNYVRRYNPATNVFTTINYPQGAENDLLTFDTEGGLWRTGTFGDVHRSTNGGQTFQMVVADGQTEGWPQKLAAYDAEHALYAVAYGTQGKLYRISSSGQVNQVGQFSSNLNLLAYNPYTGTAFRSIGASMGRSANHGLFIGVTLPVTLNNSGIRQMIFPDAGHIYALTEKELLLSTDDGLTWSVLVPDLGSFLLMAIDSDGDWLIGSWDCGLPRLRRSVDAGATITAAPDHFEMPDVERIQQHANGQLFAHTCQAGGYLRSYDFGNSWSALTIVDSISRPVTSLALLANGALLALANGSTKAWRSVDGGATWTGLPLPTGNLSAYYRTVEADALGNVYLLAGLFQSYKSADAGETWEPVALPTSMLFYGSPARRQLRFHPNGDVFITDGETIARYNSATNTNQYFDFDPSNPFSIYITGLEVTPAGDIFVIANTGSGWGLYRWDGNSTALDPIPYFQGKIIAGLTWNAVGHLFASDGEKLYRSTNGGQSWEEAGVVPAGATAALTVGTDHHIYLGSLAGRAYRSDAATADANWVIGTTWLDLDGDCAQQLPAEPGRPGVVVKATGAANFAAYSAYGGNYALAVPPGTYEVNVVPPNPLFAACSAGTTVTVDGPVDTVGVSLALETLANCPYLRVNLGTPLLRRCFANSVYTVMYCNDGTAPATALTVTVTLDSFLTLQGSSLPVLAQDGQAYTFAVGDLAPGQCGAFQLTVEVSCAAELGQVHCTSVKIEPDTLCLPTLEDRSWALDCQPNIGAYDPNDKRAFVDGVQSTGTVPPGAPVEYVIRFQNTGTDTAFTVVIEDQLSLLFDPATVEVLAASHAYTLELRDSRTLRFVFSNIMLPDSNVNEPASHGFVKFRVQPVTELPIGTPLNNYADIFFDFNAPIRTNTAELVVDWPVRTAEPAAARRVMAFPNPFGEAVTFVVQGARASEEMVLVLTDALGRVVRQQRVQGPEFTMERDGLPGGMYYFVLMSPAGRLGAGKILCIER